MHEFPSTSAPYPARPALSLELDPVFAHLREHEPFRRVQLPHGDEAVLITRYHDVRAVLADPRFSRAATVTSDAPRFHAESQSVPGSLMDLDPPEHTRLRKPAARALTVRQVERLRPRAQEVAGELLDRFARGDDLVEGFALPLPCIVLCELLGIPYTDRAEFGRWLLSYTSTTALTGAHRRDGANKIRGYLASLITSRRAEPSDDLVSSLIEAQDADDRLTDREVVDLLTVLLAAGFDTTAAHITNSVLSLLQRPGQWQLLTEHHDLVPGAVEELLRHVPLPSTETALPRYATEDVVLSGGTVRRGQPVLAARSAANRDQEIFTDPERLDITRTPGKHLAFGHGPHYCTGAALARMNLQVALCGLVERHPGLRLAVPEDQLQWKTGSLMRGPLALPVTW